MLVFSRVCKPSNLSNNVQKRKNLELGHYLSAADAAGLDRFDRAQLAEVLTVCEHLANLSAAGRELFAVSRQAKRAPNDADRLRKYLARFNLTWANIRKTSSK